MKTKTSTPSCPLIALLALIALLFALPQVVLADAKPSVAPPSGAFHAYQERQSLYAMEGFAADPYPTGYVPPPLDLSHMKGQQIFLGTPRAAATPSYFDLRTTGKLSPVRDQQSCGACWAFAAYGSLESCLLTGELWDFSENNLKNCHGFDISSCDGGNSMMTLAYLARWSGPVAEADDPYDLSSTSPITGLPVQKHVQQMITIPARADSLDNDNLKQAVMKYGAVFCNMYWTVTNLNTLTSSYYFDGNAVVNHSVCIVGWDDNYPRAGFLAPPPGNGAFIIRNSWGPDFADGGYFYISYYDTCAFSSACVFVCPEPTTNYSRIYQYDPLGWITNVGYGSSTAWFANVFTSTAAENLAAVSFYSSTPASPYEVYIYRNPASNPAGGQLATAKTGTVENPGYQTIKLDEPVPLVAGEKFSVVVKLTTPGYNYPIPIEYPIENYSSKATAGLGESYSSSDGVTWSEFTSFFPNSNVCIKAFTGAAAHQTVLTPSFSPDGGTFVAPVQVKITCGTPDAEIRYTTENRLPVVTDPIVKSGDSVLVDRTATLTARAWKSGWDPSGVKSADFIIKPARKVVYVKPTGSNSRNGLSWQDAKRTVQSGIDAASVGDEVWIVSGTYQEHIKLKSGVSVYGGFSGIETSHLSKPWGTKATVIDGGGSGSVVTVAPGVTDATVIANLTIKGGQTTNGGGIYCKDASPTICCNIIRDNKATRGGGIYCAGNASPRIIGNTIANNSSGGGIYSEGSSVPTVANNIIAFCSSGIYAANAWVPRCRNNCVYGNSLGNFRGMPPSGTDKQVDPMFMSTSSRNYHLKVGSPCLDAGDMSSALTALPDMDGQPRVYGTGVDIGADEVVLPINKSISPSSGTILIGKMLYVKSTYRHPGGCGLLSSGCVTINSTSKAYKGVCLKYDAVSNKLYLRDDLDTKWLGGLKPGTSSAIENSYCKVYCRDTIISKVGDGTVIVEWSVQFKKPFSGKTYPVWMSASDTIGVSTGWEQMGKLTFK